MSVSMISWMAAIGLIFVAGWVHKRRRAAAMRALAVRRGFRFLDRVLPATLRLTGTGLERATLIYNAMDGEVGGVRVAVFDCRIGSGKASWRRAVVAINASASPAGRQGFESALTSEASGEWTVYYQPWKQSLFGRGMTSIAQIEATLDAISNGKEA